MRSLCIPNEFLFIFNIVLFGCKFAPSRQPSNLCKTASRGNNSVTKGYVQVHGTVQHAHVVGGGCADVRGVVTDAQRTDCAGGPRQCCSLHSAASLLVIDHRLDDRW